jgi:hypothetical protein
LTFEHVSGVGGLVALRQSEKMSDSLNQHSFGLCDLPTHNPDFQGSLPGQYILQMQLHIATIEQL